MTTDSPEALFLQGLQELYYTEQQLVDVLDQLADESTEETLKDAFSHHRDVTEEQVERLEQVFEILDEESEPMQEQVIDALIEEHSQFSSENEGQILDRYNIAAGQKTEHYEIAAYGTMTSMAGKLGHDEVANLLEESLREEQEALKQLAEAGEEFDQQLIASD